MIILSSPDYQNVLTFLGRICFFPDWPSPHLDVYVFFSLVFYFIFVVGKILLLFVWKICAFFSAFRFSARNSTATFSIFVHSSFMAHTVCKMFLFLIRNGCFPLLVGSYRFGWSQKITQWSNAASCSREVGFMKWLLSQPNPNIVCGGLFAWWECLEGQWQFWGVWKIFRLGCVYERSRGFGRFCLVGFYEGFWGWVVF